MIEKYINDTIAAGRKALEERMANTNLIPPLMMQKIRIKDSLQKAKELAKELKEELNNVKDTLKSEDNLTEAEVTAGKGKKTPGTPAKDTGTNQPVKKDLLLPDDKNRTTTNKKDSVKK